jgi:hypothetical protein
MISLTLENKNEKISAVVTVLVHVLILLIAIFFVTCYKVPNPPREPDQGIEIAFGTVVEDKGETEDPFDAAPEETPSEAQPVVAPDVIEEVVEPVENPLQSEHIVKEVEVLEPITEVPDPVTETDNEPIPEPVMPTVEPEKSIPEEIKEAVKEPVKPKPFVGLGKLDVSGGDGSKEGDVGDPNATEKATLSTGLGVAEVPRGWGIATEPKPAVKESGEVTISVEFNRSGHVIPGSVKYVSGSLTLFNKNRAIITTSLEDELKFTQTDSSEAPKSRNKATFRFEFKEH